MYFDLIGKGHNFYNEKHQVPVFKHWIIITIRGLKFVTKEPYLT